MLQAGNKVVWIGRGWAPYADGSNHVPAQLPERGVVYTVRAVLIDAVGVAGIFLNEIRNTPIPPYCQEQSFEAATFRRVTDISIFQEMLKIEPERVA